MVRMGRVGMCLNRGFPCNSRGLGHRILITALVIGTSANNLGYSPCLEIQLRESGKNICQVVELSWIQMRVYGNGHFMTIIAQ